LEEAQLPENVNKKTDVVLEVDRSLKAIKEAKVKMKDGNTVRLYLGSVYGRLEGDEKTKALQDLVDFLGFARGLARNDFRAEDAKTFSSHLPKGLTDLNLEDNYLDAKAMEILAPHLPNSLAILSLKNNRLGTEAMQFLAPHLSNGLRVLCLADNCLDAKAMEILAPHLPNTLERFSLRSNRLDPEALKFLAPHLPKGLTTLYLNSE
jgi:hypothetical protein